MRYLVLLFVLITSYITHAQTERVTFQAPYAYPEGVAYNEKTKLFYVGSATMGTIGTVDASGKYTEFHKDPALKSTFGMKVDAKRNKLWVCVSDPNYSKYSDSSTFKKMARVIVFDLATSKKINDVKLDGLIAGKHFANDLTLDSDGNAYITDSFSPVIYKVDAKGTASIFAKSDLFKSIDIGLNGIAFHPQGYLLVVHNSDGVLYKVPLKNPADIKPVKINTFFNGGDGLLFDKENNLFLVQGKGVSKTFKLTSADNWVSAKVVGATSVEDRFQNPTTATWMGDKLYVLNAKLNELSDSSKSKSKEFSVQVVKLRTVN